MFSKSTVKYIQSLQHKKFRDEEGVFVAEGPKVVGELLSGNVFVCRNVYATKEWEDGLTIDQQQKLDKKFILIKDFELEKISALSTANQVVAIFEKKSSVTSPDLKNKITLLLDDVQDPGNLGTIIRIADWFGIENVICSLHTADMYNSKVVQSTMASLQRVNLIYADAADFLHSYSSIPKYAATLDGKPLSVVAKLKEAIIIIGNESKGVGPNLMELANEKITIPKFGHAESLNAAVAAGIIFYEICR